MTFKLPFLPEEHHYAIAHVATRSAQLDHMIETTIAQLLADSPRAAKFLLTNTSADRLVQLLECLLIDRCPAEEKTITNIISLIRAKRRERNEVLHWLWGTTDDPNTADMASLRPFREAQVKNKTAQELVDLAKSMLDITIILAEWPIAQQPRPQGTSPETPKPRSRPEHSASPSDGDLKDSLGLLGHL